MDQTATHEVTRLLVKWRDGDKEALRRLIPLVYSELHRLARRYVRHERFDHTLQATGLVNEAYMRLVDQKEVSWQNRVHFFGVAAQLMRRILVDYARRRLASKRGGSATRLALQDDIAIVGGQDVDLLALDEALTQLGHVDPEQSHLVELRFFAGLSIEDTAEVMGVSPATIKRNWAMARAFLFREMSGEALR